MFQNTPPPPKSPSQLTFCSNQMQQLITMTADDLTHEDSNSHMTLVLAYLLTSLLSTVRTQTLKSLVVNQQLFLGLLKAETENG